MSAFTNIRVLTPLSLEDARHRPPHAYRKLSTG
jgi:hypothetical protein